MTTTHQTATLRVEWRRDRKLALKEIVAIDADGRPVTLKVLNVTPDPAADDDPERKLLEYARRVLAQAELVVTGKKRLAQISRDGARSARKHISDAIALLQSFERSLSYRIDG
jgi:hypothetical protein